MRKELYTQKELPTKSEANERPLVYGRITDQPDHPIFGYELNAATGIERRPKPSSGPLLIATQDTQGNITIPIINHKAAANYLSGYQSQEYFENLAPMTMPRFMINGGQHAVFQVTGESMEPTFFDGEYVICTKLETSEWATIPDFNVCVVVSERLGVQLKRIKSRLKTKGFIRCKSDNKQHSDFTLRGEEILELWMFKWKLSPFAVNRAEELYKKVDTLEENLDDQRTVIEQIMEEMRQIKKEIPKTN
ncbi:S24/S26 family peptidase [Nibribacter koreensis]